MRCPTCGHEFKNPVAQAGGRAGGAVKVAKGFAVAGQPSAAARKRGWKTRKAQANGIHNAGAVPRRNDDEAATEIVSTKTGAECE